MPKEANSRRVGIRTGFGRGNSGPTPCFTCKLLSSVALNAGINIEPAAAAVDTVAGTTSLREAAPNGTVSDDRPGLIYGVAGDSSRSKCEAEKFIPDEDVPVCDAGVSGSKLPIRGPSSSQAERVGRDE